MMPRQDEYFWEDVREVEEELKALDVLGEAKKEEERRAEAARLTSELAEAERVRQAELRAEAEYKRLEIEHKAAKKKRWEDKWWGVYREFRNLNIGLGLITSYVAGVYLTKMSEKSTIIYNDRFLQEPEEHTYVLAKDGDLSNPDGSPLKVTLNATTLPILVNGSANLQEFYANHDLDLNKSSVGFDKFGNMKVELTEKETGNKVNKTFDYSATLQKLAAVDGVEEVNIIPDYTTGEPVIRYVNDPTILSEIEKIIESATGKEVTDDYSYAGIADNYNISFSGRYNFSIDFKPEVILVGQTGEKVIGIDEDHFKEIDAYVEDKNPQDHDYAVARQVWKQSLGNYVQGLVDAQLTPDALAENMGEDIDAVKEAIPYLQSRFWSGEYNQTEAQRLIAQTNISDLNDLTENWTPESKLIVLDTPDNKGYGGVALRVDGDMIPYLVPLTKQDIEAAKNYK